ncbi:MAG: hypothetical protein Q9181_008208, partial [Wetmoreana brouardii]
YFNEAPQDFAKDAYRCARLATQGLETFTKWGKMVGELHAATESQQGQTRVERNETRTAENVTKIDE